MDADRLRSAVDWRADRLEVIDQTLLPERLEVRTLSTVAEVVDALRRLVVRGAPAIGVCAAFGVVLGLDDAGATGTAGALAAVERAAAALTAARPTAANLGWAVRRGGGGGAGGRAPPGGRPPPPRGGAADPGGERGAPPRV